MRVDDFLQQAVRSLDLNQVVFFLLVFECHVFVPSCFVWYKVLLRTVLDRVRDLEVFRWPRNSTAVVPQQLCLCEHSCASVHVLLSVKYSEEAGSREEVRR